MNLGLDLACVIVRLMQIDSEERPSHWLWDRVMTCDVPRLRRMPGVDEYLDADFVAVNEPRPGPVNLSANCDPAGTLPPIPDPPITR